MSGVGDNIEAKRGAWTFGGDVCETFDDHVSKSVPLYELGHGLICKLSDFFLSGGSICYELGCSTGSLTAKLAQHNAHKDNIRFIGIDIEERMVELARSRQIDADDAHVEFHVDDILLHDYERADMFVAYYTVQFMRPALRQQLFNMVYEKLSWGGAFIMFEKVRGADARFQDIMTAIYTDYKLEQGYGESEIIAKSQSLRGVLEPFSTQGNYDMLRRAGFADYMSIMKYVCFEGFLAIK